MYFYFAATCVCLFRETMEIAHIKKFFCLSHGVFIGGEDFYSFPILPLSLIWEDLLQEVSGDKPPLASQLGLFVCVCGYGRGEGGIEYVLVCSHGLDWKYTCPIVTCLPHNNHLRHTFRTQ